MEGSLIQMMQQIATLQANVSQLQADPGALTERVAALEGEDDYRGRAHCAAGGQTVNWLAAAIIADGAGGEQVRV